MRKKISLILIIIFTIVFVVSLVKVISTVGTLNHEKATFNNLREEKEEEFKAEGDMAAWIRIPGTKIDYPVMYTPDDPQKYLHRDVKGEYSYSGTPFIDGNCKFDSDKLVVYGHNMLNGTMFSDLDKFAEKKFWKKHNVIEFETEKGRREYRIIAAIKTDAIRGEYLYYPLLEDDFLQKVRRDAFYDTGFEEDESRIIVVSTCSYHTDDGRFLIVGKEQGAR